MKREEKKNLWREIWQEQERYIVEVATGTDRENESSNLLPPIRLLINFQGCSVNVLEKVENRTWK